MNIFIDCGFYAGNALKIYMDKGIVDDTWTVYAFEPNPRIKIGSKVKGLIKVNLIKKAVWTKNSKVKLNISGREDAASVEGTTGHTKPKYSTVSSINFPQFVKKLPEAFIICSMDIEGAEYRVLEKMLADGTIDKLDLLDVEFHHRFMSDRDKEDSLDLLYEVSLRVPVKLKERFE